MLERRFRSAAIDHLAVSTAVPYDRDLLRFFKDRAGRVRRPAMILAVLAARHRDVPAGRSRRSAISITIDVSRAGGARRVARLRGRLAQHGNRVVVRTFEPRPFALSGTMGNVRFRNLDSAGASVLKQDDDLTPAPLAPPRPMP